MNILNEIRGYDVFMCQWRKVLLQLALFCVSIAKRLKKGKIFTEVSKKKMVAIMMKEKIPDVWLNIYYYTSNICLLFDEK